MPSEVERLRARFRVEDRPDAGRRRTADERIRAALDLHAFNLLLTLDKVRNQRAGAGEANLVDEVNRRRLARSPMPQPLDRRMPRRDANPRSQ